MYDINCEKLQHNLVYDEIAAIKALITLRHELEHAKQVENGKYADKNKKKLTEEEYIEQKLCDWNLSKKIIINGQEASPYIVETKNAVSYYFSILQPAERYANNAALRMLSEVKKMLNEDTSKQMIKDITICENNIKSNIENAINYLVNIIDSPEITTNNILTQLDYCIIKYSSKIQKNVNSKLENEFIKASIDSCKHRIKVKGVIYNTEKSIQKTTEEIINDR